MMKLTDLVVVIFLLNLINLNLIDLKFKHIILALLCSIFLIFLIILMFLIIFPWKWKGMRKEWERIFAISFPISVHSIFQFTSVFPYIIYTTFKSLLCIEMFSICNIHKDTFIYTCYRHFFYTTYRQNYLCIYCIWTFFLYTT